LDLYGITAFWIGETFVLRQETKTRYLIQLHRERFELNVSSKMTDKRGTSSATQWMLQERDRQIYAEEAASGESSA